LIFRTWIDGKYTVIRLTDFSKIYYSKSDKTMVTGVSNVSFSAEKDTITGLLGLNGAGKTTIIRAICALHYATSGHVFVGDNSTDPVDASIDPVRVRELTGFVAEQPLLYENFTVKEFLETVASIRISDKRRRLEALERVISDCTLQEVLGVKITVLSKGFRQRVAFAQALIHDPPVLVFDEPSSGLDPVQIYKMRQFIIKLAKGRTILLSTHILQEAEMLCSSVCILLQGKLIISGPVKDITDKTGSASFEEAFLKLTGSGVFS
jgi:ABC-2 type transport system ATP-binding protein